MSSVRFAVSLQLSVNKNTNDVNDPISIDCTGDIASTSWIIKVFTHSNQMHMCAVSDQKEAVVSLTKDTRCSFEPTPRTLLPRVEIQQHRFRNRRGREQGQIADHLISCQGFVSPNQSVWEPAGMFPEVSGF